MEERSLPLFEGNEDCAFIIFTHKLAVIRIVERKMKDRCFSIPVFPSFVRP